MNLNKLHAAYEKAIDAMLEASPEMPRELAEQAVQAIAELVLATINAELTKEPGDATDHN